jgi:restriction endonuclease Mrr
VAPEWHTEFQQFIETGDAEEVFLDYLNQDSAAQDAVEKAFNRQAAQFERLAAELKKRKALKGRESSVSAARSSTPSKLAAVVEAAIHTPQEQREQVVQTSTAELAASMPAEERKVLKEVVRSLENNLSKLVDATHPS